MATVFIPPTAPLVPAAIKSQHPGFQLMRHYRPWDAGVNVWLLNDGTVTRNDPADDTVVRRVFHGGHIHPVDAAEAAILTAAGYTVVEADATTYSAGLPGFADVTSSGDTVDPGF